MLNPPGPMGLYDPAFEHDACGVAFVADMHGRASHDVVAKAITALKNLEHRGGVGDDGVSGDGAGVLIQVPDAFYRAAVDFDLPEAGRYATGIGFLPSDEDAASGVRGSITKIAHAEGLTIAGWRAVSIDADALGATARTSMPSFWQIFVTGSDDSLSGLDLERRVYVLRKRVERELVDTAGRSAAYFPSLSSRTIVYKGMFASTQLDRFYADLNDDKLISAIGVVHSRFSTNTFPSWPLAHPFRYVAHNGEINTARGNRTWMQAREGALDAHGFGDGELSRILPVCTPGMSDSASFDEVLELLHLAGRPIHHAMLMMIPAAWENDETMPDAHRAFFEHHASLMEPWDGPAAVAFTDGTVVGAVLDRNGLRPGRYVVTDDGLVVVASEAGVLPIDAADVVAKGRVRPGRMFMVDTAKGRIVRDTEIKDELAAEYPYADWVADSLVSLEDLPERPHTRYPHSSVVRRQQTFGYTTEELNWIIIPMAMDGVEAIGSMGSDTPIAVLSERPRLLFDYFSQLFAQGANPPLDANREQFVTSMRATIGADGNLLDADSPTPPRVILSYPVIDNDELAKLIHIDEDGTRAELAVTELSILYPVAGGGDGLRDRLDELCAAAAEAVRGGAPNIVLSDRHSDEANAPIPSLLATSAVHHHLVREKLRSEAAIIVEAGDAREVHHMAALVAYGASAINPYLVFETLQDLADRGMLEKIGANRAVANYLKAASKGVLKVMSKMGICTLASYTGSQMFEALGLSHELVDTYFTGTTSRLGGIGLAEIAKEVAERHQRAYLERPEERAHRELEGGGEYQWRREGEVHLFNPQTVFKLQHGTRERRYDIFQQYTRAIDDQAGRLATLRGLLRFADGVRESVPLDEVEPVSEIVKRFATGAMSYGSISAETHETLAIAMNRIGGKSNSGEGGEAPERLYDPERRSAIKQVASARFGVTAEYLSSADDIQIKVAQGAKPGEGGHLPGHKVYPWIAEVRHSTPGVGLISPPTHHDVNSIEDSGELIFDLKNANPDARIHVKLVAQSGVGTVAAAASKSGSDVVLISGHDGGTGAASLTALKHAGGLWELGLAETQQTLLANGLRDRISVQVDGQLKTGRDVVIAALLGAEEFGFATAPLVVSGCIMMRVCHLNTCPVGIATQDPVLRERYRGTPEFVETFFEYIAEEVRELLAELGFRSIDEAVGQVEALDVAEAVAHYKTAGLDLSPVLAVPDISSDAPRRAVRTQDDDLIGVLDHTIVADSQGALENRERVELAYPVTNANRAVGTLLGHEVVKRHRGEGLPDDTIDITLTGTAGQSLGAFLPSGVTLRLEGDANDHLGKGLSGGRIVARPSPDTHPDYVAEVNTIAGNVIGYGATGGELFLRGRVGERFCVRNSGATAVVEGVGNHACEYMTGGRAVILGPTGRNFGAGMSGGIAYVWDPNGRLKTRLNTEMVELDDLDDLDRTWLVSMIYRHRELTGSEVADRLLADWTFAADQFVKVMPRDYKRVLRAIVQAEEDGEDIEEAIMAAAAG